MCEGPDPAEIPLLNGDPSLTVGSSHVCSLGGYQRSVKGGGRAWGAKHGRPGLGGGVQNEGARRRKEAFGKA